MISTHMPFLKLLLLFSFLYKAGEFAVRKARLANSQRKYYASQFCVQKDPDSCNDSDDEADDESWLKLESDLVCHCSIVLIHLKVTIIIKLHHL